jgi:WD40 repeat protein
MLVMMISIFGECSLHGQTPKLVTQLGHEEAIASVSISPNGKLLASADIGGIVKIWDLQTGTNRYTLNGFPPVRFTSNGKFLIVQQKNIVRRSGESKKAASLFISTEDWQEKSHLGRQLVNDLVANDAYAIVMKPHRIKLVPKVKGMKRKRIENEGAALVRAAVDISGRYVAAAWWNGELCIYDLSTQQLKYKIKNKVMYAKNFAFRCPFSPSEFDNMQFSTSGKLLLFGNEQQISIANVERGEVVHKIFLKPNYLKRLGAVTDSASQPNSRLIFTLSATYQPSLDAGVLELRRNQALGLGVVSKLPANFDLEKNPHLDILHKVLDNRRPNITDLPWTPGNPYATKHILVTKLFNEACGCNLQLGNDPTAPPSNAFTAYEARQKSDTTMRDRRELETAEILRTSNAAYFGNCLTCSGGARTDTKKYFFEPLLPSKEKDSALNIPPNSALIAYFRYYAANDSNYLLYPDTLEDIAWARRDHNLMKLLTDNHKEATEGSRDIFADMKATLQKNGVEKQSDSLVGKSFEYGKKREKGFAFFKRNKVLDNFAFKLSPNEKYVSFLTEKEQIILFDVETGAETNRFEIPLKNITDFEFSNDGHYIVTATGERAIAMYHLPDWKLVRVFSRTSFPVNQSLANNDFTGLMTGDFAKQNGGANFWNLSTAEKIGYIEHENMSFNQVGFDSVGKFLLSEGIVKVPESFQTMIYDFGTKSKIEIPVTFGLQKVLEVQEEHGKILVAGGAYDKGMLAERKIGTGTLIHAHSLGKTMLNNLCATQDHQYLFATGLEGKMYSLDPISIQAKDSITIGQGWIHALEMAPDDSLLAIGGNDAILRIYDFRHQIFRDSAEIGSVPIKQLQYAHDGKWIAIADWSDRVQIWQTNPLQFMANLPWRNERIEAMEFSSDGKFLLTNSILGSQGQGTGLNIDHLWDWQNRKLDTRFESKDTASLPPIMALNPARPQILMGGNGSPICGYDLQTGKRAFTCSPQSSRAVAATFAPDGMRFYTASNEYEDTYGNSLDGTTSGDKIRYWSAQNGYRLGVLGLRFEGLYIAGHPAISVQNLLKTRDLEVTSSGNYLKIKHWNGAFSVIDLKNQSKILTLPNASSYYDGLEYYAGNFYHYYNGKYKERLESMEQLDKQAKRILGAIDVLPETSFDDSLVKPVLLLVKDLTELHLMHQSARRNFPGVQQMKGERQVKILEVLPVTKMGDAPLAQRDTVVFENLKRILPYRKGILKAKGALKIGSAFRKRINTMHLGTVNAIQKSQDKRHVLSTGDDTQVVLWDQETQQAKLQMVSTSDNTGFLFFNQNNEYLCTQSASSMVCFAMGAKMYPFEAFDLYQNRPDLVLKALPMQDSASLAPYYHAYLRRLKRMGAEPPRGELEFVIPNIEIFDSGIDIASLSAEFKIRVKAEETSGYLNRLQAWVNDVPVYGLDGLDLQGRHISLLDTVLPIQLSDGKNKIQFSAINDRLNTSWKETAIVNYIGPPTTKRLFVVTVGVSDYANGIADLKFPASDAQKLATFLKENAAQKTYFESVSSLVLTNEEVQTNALQKIEQFLSTAQEDDVVILFLSGHGENSPLDYEYYFLLPHFDGFDYAQNTMAFQDIDAMLAKVRSRNKFLILNTCMAGDVDDQAFPMQAESNFITMKELFLDLRRSSGATVFAASSGYGYAKESLHDGEASGPMVKFLTEYLSVQRSAVSVKTLCEGLKTSFERQRAILDMEPEIRFLNLANDFRIW